jgi:predicted DNA-binding protein (UPF0251 family)
MPRPRICRRVHCEPSIKYFKPRGVPLPNLEVVSLTVDEFEAIRLKDFEGLEQEKAAERMNVSQPTFHRIVESARRKVADALTNGKAIRIEGGNYVAEYNRKFKCYACGHEWEEPHGTGRPDECPKCGSSNFHRAPEDRGYARAGKGRRWQSPSLKVSRKSKIS